MTPMTAVGNAVQPDGLAHGFAFGEQLFLGVAAEEGDVARVLVVFVVVETALRGRDAANFAERRKSADHRDGAAVKKAADLHVAAKFGHDVFAGRRFRGDVQVIVFHPVHDSAGARAASLHAGAAGKYDHDVLAKRLLILLDAVAQALRPQRPSR